MDFSNCKRRSAARVRLSGEDSMMDQSTFEDLSAHIQSALTREIKSVSIVSAEISIQVERDHIVDVLRFLRDDSQCLFETLIDICGVDYPDRTKRFEIVYHLLSMRMNQRIRVKLSTDEDSPVPTVVGVYAVADWYEREAFDMYGVVFSDHPDLRRILTDYGFEGYPLRKNFPLTGHVEVRYDDLEKRVVYEQVNLTQEYRDFDFLSPWEGMTKEPSAAVDQDDGVDSDG